MGVLGKIFRREHRGKGVETPPCPHTSLVQRWDSPEQIGNAEVAHYVCESCGQTFSYEQAQSFLKQTESHFRDAPR